MFLAVAPGTAALVWIVPLAMEQQPHEPISAASDQLLSAGLCNNLQGILGVFCTTLWSQVQGELNRYDIFAIPGQYTFGPSYYVAVAGWAAAGAAGCLLMSIARRRPMAALARGQYGAVPGV